MGATAQDGASLTDIAAGWLVALDAGTADRDAFEAWRSASPYHASAFAQVAATWNRTADRRMAALRPAGEPGGLSPALQDIDAEAEEIAAPVLTRRRMVGGLAAGIAAVAGIGAFTAWPRRAMASTGVGERRDVVLPDGSRAMLNTDSRMAWRFGAAREIWLERGEVLLALNGDAAGELRLYTAPFEARLQPGRYNARLTDGGATFLALKGAARIDPEGAAAQSLSAGQKLTVDATSLRIADMAPAEMDDVVAWQRGEIVFSGMTLGDAVREFNRYLGAPIIVRDPGLRQTRLGGRFELDDPQRFLAALDQGFGIAHRRTESGTELYLSQR